MSKNTQKEFMDFVVNPTEITKKKGFSIGVAAVRFTSMLFFAFGGSIVSGFKLDNIADVLAITFWIQFALLFFEQSYSRSIGYDLMRTLMLDSHDVYNETETETHGIINGVVDPQTNKLINRPLQKDTKYIPRAIEQINDEEKVELVRKRMKELVSIFESQLAIFESYKKKGKMWFWFPKIIRITKHKRKFFWKTQSAIDYCKKQIEDGEQLIKDKEAALSVPDDNVSGYTALSWSDLATGQEEAGNGYESKYHMRSEKEAKARGTVKRAGIKFVTSALGPAVVWGTLNDVEPGFFFYTIFIMIVQLFMGAWEARTNVNSIVVVNSMRRNNAVKRIKDMIPDIKQKLEDEEKQEQAEKAQAEQDVEEEEQEKSWSSFKPAPSTSK